MSSVIKVTFITVLFNASHVLQPNHLPVTVAEAEFICESGRNCCYTQAPLLCRDRAVMVRISPGHWCVHITVVSNREKQWKWCPLGWVLDGCSIMSSSVTSSAGLSVPLARHQAVWCGQHSCGLRCHDSVYKKKMGMVCWSDGKPTTGYLFSWLPCMWALPTQKTHNGSYRKHWMYSKLQSVGVTLKPVCQISSSRSSKY